MNIQEITLDNRPKRKPRQQSLMEKIRLDESSGCWIWLGSRKGDGYGGTTFHGKLRKVSRVFAYMFKGIPLIGGVVMHSCDNKICINPAHLSHGTQLDNIRDCIAKGRYLGYTKQTDAASKSGGGLASKAKRLIAAKSEQEQGGGK